MREKIPWGLTGNCFQKTVFEKGSNVYRTKMPLSPPRPDALSDQEKKPKFCGGQPT